MTSREPTPLQNLAETFEIARHKRKAVRTSFGAIEYLRLTDRFGSLPRGTVMIGDQGVFGYPSIGRLLALKPGLRAHFQNAFWVEEKVNGYNVRIFRRGDHLLALTRGGFICPFTTDRIVDLLDPGIFDQEPDLVVCGEMAGPEQPYLESHPPFVVEDVQLFVFDLMRLNRPGFLPQPEAYALMESLGLRTVQRFGRFTAEAIPAIHDILLRLNVEGREGLVFKEEGGHGRRAKYVTSDSSIADIRVTAAEIMELPPEFFTNRILRLVLFLREQGLSQSAPLNERLGAAFLDGLMEAIHQFEDDQKVSRRFRCRFHDKHHAFALMQHLDSVGGHQVHITWQDLRFEDGFWILEFDKLYASLTGLLATLMSGGLVFD